MMDTGSQNNGKSRPCHGAKDEILQELRNIFIQTISHELRTPISIIEGYADLLNDGTLGQLLPEQQNAIRAIAQRALELRTLAERVGVLLSAQAHTPVWLPTALSKIVTQVASKKRETAAQAGLILELEIDASLPPIMGDPFQLEHAIECLLDNAIKFTPRGGHVLVQVYQDGSDWICVSVRDTGIGMTEEQMRRVFEPFTQADGSMTRRYGGLGLGLSVTKAVIEAHAGQLEVQSTPEQGSQFVMRLPATMISEAAPQTMEAAPLRRILVVDDDPNVALTLQAGLEKLPNCTVAVATSGEEALRIFKREPFDLLITDYKMPGMDGLMLASHIHQEYPRTAIVVITAYETANLLEQAVQTSVKQVLGKPIGLEEIRSVALTVLEPLAGRNGGVRHNYNAQT